MAAEKLQAAFHGHLSCAGKSISVVYLNTAHNTASTSEHEPSQLRLHPRRTLDHYSFLVDTTVRDADQSTSKGTGNNGQEGGSIAEDDSRLIIIDQLWCWVLDEKLEFCDFYESILKSVDGCTTVWELQSLIAQKAPTHIFNEKNRDFTDLIEIYSWMTGKEAASQKTYFQEFYQAHSRGNSTSTFLGDLCGLTPVLKVADLMDELKMIRHLVDNQREVLKFLISGLRKLNPSRDQPHAERSSSVKIATISCSDQAIFALSVQNYQCNIGVSGAPRDHVVSADEILVLLLTEIENMKDDVVYTQKMLLNLLDLKQKTASLEEARSTTQQGRAVMLFTIVIVILNVSEITGDDKNPSTWDLRRIGRILLRSATKIFVTVTHIIAISQVAPR
ncbi:hypothetical protein DM02DRAFT_632249 [Periconia macrospinosa]|uniref:Uncharacterized protein n=1 Tax=Periconia macrospinosa TaxID=97972 RepID=A0A2V1DDQ0_9PLEO|nr:hypothetical protein DM02DRAFT_632249 [Periconia macrospinosa]